MTPARKAWEEANRDHLRAYRREWMRANREKVREYERRMAEKEGIKQRRAKRAAQTATWRKKNPEKAKATGRASYHRRKALGKVKPSIITPEQKKRYREKYREIEKAYAKARYAANREALLEVAREYRRRDPDVWRRWRAANPERWREVARESNQRRRAAQLSAPGDGVTKEEWKDIVASYRSLCVYCNTHVKRPTMDHIVPLSQGGAHDVSNVVPACRGCNARKNDTTLIVWLAKKLAA